MRIQRRISLPLELDDHIIDQLDREEDVKTILNCALVSRIWLPATRRKLYRHVAIRSREQWERFNSTLGSLGNTLEEGVQKYLKQAHTHKVGGQQETNRTVSNRQTGTRGLWGFGFGAETAVKVLERACKKKQPAAGSQPFPITAGNSGR